MASGNIKHAVKWFNLSTEFIEAREGRGRLEAFSDGVFAIAMTLLVLNLNIKELTHGTHLLDALVMLWPSFLSYAVSFMVLGIIWANHHYLFSYIKRVDHLFLLINVLFLMIVAFIPFPASLIAGYLHLPAERRAAALFYSGTMVLMALAYLGIWSYATLNHRLVDSALEPAFIRITTRRYRYGLFLYLLAFTTAYWSFAASMAIQIFIALFFMLPARR